MRKIVLIVFLTLFGVQMTIGQIFIANTYVVNTDIYDTIIGDYVSGLITYNPETRTLTLEDATIFERTPQPMEISDGALFFAGTYSDRLDTINVRLLGENTLVSHSTLGWGITGYYCTQINVLGPGSLIVGGFPGISLDYVQELTIQEGATLRFPQPTATGFEYVGIVSHYERTPVLIDSSTLICESGTPFRNIADLQLSRCHINVPENAHFDGPTGTMLNADNTQVTGFFSIVPGGGTAVPQCLEERSFNIYPNPVHDYVQVQCTTRDAQQWEGANVKVFDVHGKLLKNVRVSSEITSLNVSSFANGMYFVRVKTGTGVASKPFVKE